jgi:hypothetical protein
VNGKAPANWYLLTADAHDARFREATQAEKPC